MIRSFMERILVAAVRTAAGWMKTGTDKAALRCLRRINRGGTPGGNAVSSRDTACHGPSIVHFGSQNRRLRPTDTVRGREQKKISTVGGIVLSRLIGERQGKRLVSPRTSGRGAAEDISAVMHYRPCQSDCSASGQLCTGKKIIGPKQSRSERNLSNHKSLDTVGMRYRRLAGTSADASSTACSVRCSSAAKAE